jgi:hypothetical protein
MSKVEDTGKKNSVLKQIFNRLQLKGIIISLSLLLLVLTIDSCATQYKHRKFKSIPCPCETRYKR